MSVGRRRTPSPWLAAIAVGAFVGLCSVAALAGAAPAATLEPCRVVGHRVGVMCGRIDRPLDPDREGGARITIEYVVVPAMARNKLADPVFLLAGGPGQSAIAVLPQAMAVLARLNNRRDIVFVDQRGTGRSAPLACKDPEDSTLAEQSEPERQQRLIAACKAKLLERPYLRSESDLGFFSTWIAARDLDAVRDAIGAERINLVGGSYGTRVALEYQRQFGKRVRRSVLDGVAPPDMVLPESIAIDNEAAWRAVLAACAAEPACARAHPGLEAKWQALLQGLPREVTASHPLTGREERFTLTREMVLGAVRFALYVPTLASALPEAIDAASRGALAPLLGLGSTVQARKGGRLAMGMHLSVVCSEDVPRLGRATLTPALSREREREQVATASADFGDVFAKQYVRMCAAWPRGPVPAAFYTLVSSDSPVLVLSGGLDPATPPRHGERVARALGRNARHVVVANAGHGVMAIGCMRDVVFRFIDADTDAGALAVDTGCAARVPRPPAFRSIAAAVAAAPASAAASEPGR